MTDWQMEQLAVGIVVFAMIMHLIAMLRLCDRVTRLEALVKLTTSQGRGSAFVTEQLADMYI